jgi:DNA-binding NtrC family response regulator
MVMAEGEWVTEAALPARLRLTAAAAENGRPQGPGSSGSLREEVQCVAERREKELILEALRQAGGSRTRAARALGVSRKTLFNKMTSLEIRWPE